MCLVPVTSTSVIINSSITISNRPPIKYIIQWGVLGWGEGMDDVEGGTGGDSGVGGEGEGGVTDGGD